MEPNKFNGYGLVDHSALILRGSVCPSNHKSFIYLCSTKCSSFIYLNVLCLLHLIHFLWVFANDMHVYPLCPILSVALSLLFTDFVHFFFSKSVLHVSLSQWYLFWFFSIPVCFRFWNVFFFSTFSWSYFSSHYFFLLPYHVFFDPNISFLRSENHRHH